ncbi:cell division protein ZapA [Rhodovulum imhoffii]|uniref:Cell division protein ZapA n=1 Tax=Rhodovulum imhoffii TaxID=365340 RepID=A0A2T5BQG6_9RHOB|nr:cell division protein ZapA [Rhodovulum imhoffii]MBK5934930.1 cell division protein ZapA [Rhodovulum imhoffii]PTN01396.1 cell division protein ZapA [Rhodovulum imhoffii]
MPDVQITIGGRMFEVACQQGEEEYLQNAVRLLDTEARAANEQIGRLTESRMLLMAGLMLADKAAGMERKLRALEAAHAQQVGELEKLKDAPLPAPERVEVPVIPAGLRDLLAELAARTEALADAVEEKQTRVD